MEALNDFSLFKSFLKAYSHFTFVLLNIFCLSFQTLITNPKAFHVEKLHREIVSIWKQEFMNEVVPFYYISRLRWHPKGQCIQNFPSVSPFAWESSK